MEEYMKKIIIFVLVLFFLLNCSKSYKEYDAKILDTFIPEKISLMDPVNNIGIYKSMFYSWEDQGEEAFLKFVDMQGNLKKKVKFVRGKGPGEIFRYGTT